MTLQAASMGGGDADQQPAQEAPPWQPRLCIIQQNTKMGSRKMICATLMAVKLPFSARMPSQLTGSCSSPAAAQRRS